MTALSEVVDTARAAISAGDALRAVDILDGIPDAEHTTASRQAFALALLRAGALSRSGEQIEKLLRAGNEDEETLGLAARHAKTRWQLGDGAALPAARDAYLHAFRRTGGWWTGINAATATLAAGDPGAARALAAEVAASVERDLGIKEDFWAVATLAEARLLLGEREAASRLYARAVALDPHAWGHLRSARDNARTILRAFGEAGDALDSLFPRVTVAAFTGHMLDAPGRRPPRFPASDEGRAASAIASVVETLQVDIGIAAGACGADILFLEAVKRRERPIHMVLPYPPAEFRASSVERGGDAWVRRFDALLHSAEEVTVLSAGPGGDLFHQHQGAASAGFALLRAQALGGRALGIAYSEGTAGSLGGTGCAVAEWRQHGLPTHVIPCGETADAPAPDPGRDWRRDGDQRTVAILFADAVGFSKFDEMGLRDFVRSFLGRVSSVLRELPPGIVQSANTWGDALYLVCTTVTGAARAALALADPGLRVALHAGPATELQDPVTGQPTMIGTHVTRAARMEPVTPPGQVYVSDAFAALLAFDDAKSDFTCEYVGTVPLAKGFGRQRTYRLARR